VTRAIETAAKHPIALNAKRLAGVLDVNTVHMAADAAFWRERAELLDPHGVGGNSEDAAAYRRAVHSLGVVVLGDLLRAVKVSP
jgi:hypothetical protein